MNKKRFYKSLAGVSETQNSELKEKTLKRWEIAQGSEEEHWDNFSTDFLLKGTQDRYNQKAKILLKEWSGFININKNLRILQVGCGPTDVINYFNIGKTYSIDPLADFYKKKFNFNYKKSNLIKGAGENIPFPDNYFDVVILINVLDHTHSPNKVLSEISRVLKDKGIFHFENYIFQKRFLKIIKLWGKIKENITRKMFNIHHPYMFTMQDLKNLLSKRFSIMKEEVGRDIGSCENIEELRAALLKNERNSLRISALLGLYAGINYTGIYKKINL
jgi:ubiquinone/menaquinone biosynthesis C-methylase UbiE